MRLIDADALIEKAWDADTRVGYVQVVDVGDILDAPTIEPQCPKGEWIDGFMCSVCRKGYRSQPTIRGVPMFKYCPECGADMRGKQDAIN